ncbi:MAG TPA: hypothetical protein VFS51_04345 [Gemmatimonadales bacterium]|nr:hypothetical protein [Gemmatimonadales bacterium]
MTDREGNSLVDSVPTLREFQAKEHISVDMLSDFEREVSRKYGTLIEDKFLEDSPGSRLENRELLAQLEKHQRSA